MSEHHHHDVHAFPETQTQDATTFLGIELKGKHKFFAHNV